MEKTIFDNAESFHNALSEIEQGSPVEDVDTGTNDDVSDGDDLPPLDDDVQEQEVQQEDASEEQEEEQEVDSDDEDDDYKEDLDEQNRVPLSRLKKEANKRKALEEKYQLQRDEYVRTQTELDNIKKALEIYNQQEDVDDTGDADYEPIDTEADKRYKKELDALKQKIEQLEGGNKQTNASIAQQAFVNTVTTQQAQFEQKNPDFKEAMSKISDIEYRKALRIAGSEEEAQKITRDSMAGIAATFYSRGEDVAASMYELAKDYGYTPKKSGGNGVNIDAIERNMAKSKGVSSIKSTSGSPVNTNPDAYLRKENVHKIQTRKGGSIDPAKFKKILDGIQSN